MTIEKLPSGSYRIKQQFNGRRYSVTVPYKPTQREALQLMAEKTKDALPKHGRTTFRQSAMEYVRIKENVLSPRTVREYGLYINRLPESFTSLYTADIMQADIQRCVNVLSADKAPKTVRTLHGFISAVLGQFRPELRVSTTLPQKEAKEPYIPSDSEVKNILEHSKGTQFYVPLVLACYSCRRSEICALEFPADLDVKNNIVHINKALVEDKDGKWVVKATKTTKSTRDIIIPEEVVKIIQEQGYFYNGSPQSISNYLLRTQRKLGIPEFSVHKLRHYFASKMMDMGVDQKTIQDMGGWSTDSVLKTVYQHSMIMKDADRRKKISDALGSAFL